jgi:hypothetical protein
MKVHSVFCDHSTTICRIGDRKMVAAKRGTWRFWILVVLRRLGITGLLGLLEWACSDRAGLSVRRCSSLPLVRSAKRVHFGLVCLIGGIACTLARALPNACFTVFWDIPGISRFNTPHILNERPLARPLSIPKEAKEGKEAFQLRFYSGILRSKILRQNYCSN